LLFRPVPTLLFLLSPQLLSGFALFLPLLASLRYFLVQLPFLILGSLAEGLLDGSSQVIKNTLGGTRAAAIVLPCIWISGPCRIDMRLRDGPIRPKEGDCY
jgi:hypothetical protein